MDLEDSYLLLRGLHLGRRWGSGFGEGDSQDLAPVCGQSSSGGPHSYGLRYVYMRCMHMVVQMEGFIYDVHRCVL